MKENLEIVRAACIKAQPQLSGNHIFNPGRAKCICCDTPMKWIDRNVHLETQIIEEGGGSSQEVTITEYNEEGKPCLKNVATIGLASVLFAMVNAPTGRQIGNYFLDPKGDFWKIITENEDGDWHMENLDISWEICKDDLSQQSEKTLQFLAKLLK